MFGSTLLSPLQQVSSRSDDLIAVPDVSDHEVVSTCAMLWSASAFTNVSSFIIHLSGASLALAPLLVVVLRSSFPFVSPPTPLAVGKAGSDEVFPRPRHPPPPEKLTFRLTIGRKQEVFVIFPTPLSPSRLCLRSFYRCTCVQCSRPGCHTRPSVCTKLK